jgi:hypothetical protein
MKSPRVLAKQFSCFVVTPMLRHHRLHIWREGGLLSPSSGLFLEVVFDG